MSVLDLPFFARGHVATAGGCLASQYLATWIIARAEGTESAERALHYVAHAIRNAAPYLHGPAATVE